MNVKMLAVTALILVSSASARAESFYGMFPPIQECEQHIWGSDCPHKNDHPAAHKTSAPSYVPAQADRTSAARNPDQQPETKPDQKAQQDEQASTFVQPSQALTSEDYEKQVMWKNIPKKYLLRPDEQKLLGQLQPEARDIPLPLLKFLLKPKSETPAQTREDYKNYVEWNEHLDSLVSGGATRMVQYEKGSGAFDTPGSVGAPASGNTNISAEATKRLFPILSSYGAAASGPLPIPGKDLFIIYDFNSDCPFCHRMAPVLEDFVQRHPGVTVLGYDQGEPVGLGIAYMKKIGFDIKVVPAHNDILSKLGVSSQRYPRTIIFDKKTGAFQVVRGYNPEGAIASAVRILAIGRAGREH